MKTSNTLFGMNVTTSALVTPVPVLRLSPDFNACTDAFKEEMNQWLLDTFGTKEVAYMIGSDTLILNHALLAKIYLSTQHHYTDINAQ